MQLRLPNTPMNRGASEQIYSRAYMAVCASVCVVKKKNEKVKNEDIVSCNLSTL